MHESRLWTREESGGNTGAGPGADDGDCRWFDAYIDELLRPSEGGRGGDDVTTSLLRVRCGTIAKEIVSILRTRPPVKSVQFRQLSVSLPTSRKIPTTAAFPRAAASFLPR
jgi:hypothetical protein